MGIKIRNDAPHDVIALVFTYITAPHPSLFYRKTLVIPRGERINCPTWQSAVKIYTWEADENAQVIAQRLEKKLGKINAARLALAPIGGEILGSLATALETFVDGAGDALLEGLIEQIIDGIIDELQEKLDKSDEMFDRQTNQAIEIARQNSKGAFKRSMAKKLFFFTQNALFLRRQYSIHHNRLGELEINGAGMSWFD